MLALPRSSLEEMLDALQRIEQKKLEPPVLPARPKASFRSRPPSPKGPLRTNCEFAEKLQLEDLSRKTAPELKPEEKANTNQVNLLSESRGNDDTGYITSEIVGLENAEKQVLQGTLIVQKCFRGYCVRRDFQEFKRGIQILQSYIHGEITRKKYYNLLRLRKLDVCKKLDEQHMAVVQYWPGRSISEVKDLPADQMSPSTVEELQKRVLAAEAMVREKETENKHLREQVQKFEAQGLKCESKLKSMEQMWHKQMASHQMNSTAMENSHVHGKSEVKSSASPIPRDIQFSSNNNDAKLRGGINDGLNGARVSDIQEIAAIKSRHSTSRNLLHKLQRLKPTLVGLKRYFMFRLPKPEVPMKHSWKWWGKEKRY